MTSRDPEDDVSQYGRLF